MKKFIFSLLVISGAIFGDSMSEGNTTERNMTESYVYDEYNVSSLIEGLDAYNKADYELAIKLLSKHIESNDKDICAYINRGASYDNLKDYYSAIKDFTKVIELNPNDFNAYYNRGVSYNNLEKYDLAIKDYTKSIKLNPNFFGAYNNRGALYSKLKDYSSAIKDFNTAIKLNPKFFEAYFNRGVFYDDLKKYNLAIKDFTKAIKLNPNDACIYSSRGFGYYKLKKYDLSIKDFNKAIELDSNDSSAYTNLLEMSIIINKDFNTSLEKKLIELIKEDKETSCKYEMLQIVQSISTNNSYNLTPKEWDEKYKDIKIESWDFEELDEWANNTKDKDKKAKLKNAIKIFKTHK